MDKCPTVGLRVWCWRIVVADKRPEISCATWCGLYHFTVRLNIRLPVRQKLLYYWFTLSRCLISAVAGRGWKRASTLVVPDRCLPLCPHPLDCSTLTVPPSTQLQHKRRDARPTKLNHKKTVDESSCSASFKKRVPRRRLRLTPNCFAVAPFPPFTINLNIRKI